MMYIDHALKYLNKNAVIYNDEQSRFESERRFA